VYNVAVGGIKGLSWRRSIASKYSETAPDETDKTDKTSSNVGFVSFVSSLWAVMRHSFGGTQRVATLNNEASTVLSHDLARGIDPARMTAQIFGPTQGAASSYFTDRDAAAIDKRCRD
jgi:hypothetical protein